MPCRLAIALPKFAETNRPHIASRSNMATEEPPASAPAAAEEEEAAPAPALAAVIDPCDPKRLMFDSIDLLAYEIITNPSKRAERKGQLEVGVFRLRICLCRINLYMYVYHWGFWGKSSLPRNEPNGVEGWQPCIYIQCSYAPCISYKFHYSLISQRTKLHVFAFSFLAFGYAR